MKLFDQLSHETSLDKLEEVSEFVSNACKQYKLSKRETQNALLLLEEVSVCLLQNKSKDKFIVTFEKKLGNYYLRISHKNIEVINPLTLIKEYDEENIEESSRHAIFTANKQILDFSHKKNVNTVSIKIHEAGNRLIYYTFAAMILGIVTGILIKNFTSESVATSLSSHVLDIIPTLFINALKLCLAPLVFCSIETSISGLTDVSKFGKMAAKILMMYLVTSILALMLGYGLASIFFKNGVGFTIAGATTTTTVTSTADTIRNTIVGIIPQDLASPIINGDMMQIIFVAVFVGICANSLGEKIKPLNDLIDAGYTLCMKLVSTIMKFLPISCFCSMAKSMIDTGTQSIMTLMKLILLYYFACLIIIVVYILMVGVLGKLNPIQYAKKVLPYLLTPFSLSSSAASVPMTVDMCIHQLGIDQKLTYFSIPLGATINMNGTCTYLVLGTYLFFIAAGIPMNFGIWLNIFITILLLAIGSPGVPGGLIINFTTIFSIVGIPMEAVTLLMGVNQFSDMASTAVNVFGDITSTTIVAANDHVIDYDIYNAK